MAVREPRYSKEEFARRGDEIYETQVRPVVEAGNCGKIVAIDIETGTFELAEDTIAASDKLLARCPNAQIWRVRVGSKAVHRFGVQNFTQQWETWESLSQYGVEKVRVVARERGYNWDTMTEEEREVFIDAIVHEE